MLNGTGGGGVFSQRRMLLGHGKKVSDSVLLLDRQGGRLIDRRLNVAEVFTDLTEKLIQKQIISFVEKVHNCGAVSLNAINIH